MKICIIGSGYVGLVTGICFAANDKHDLVFFDKNVNNWGFRFCVLDNKDMAKDYEDVINGLDDDSIYIIYCSGGECSLSIDLADYLYNEKLFDKLLIFEGGWPEWQDAGYP